MILLHVHIQNTSARTKVNLSLSIFSRSLLLSLSRSLFSLSLSLACSLTCKHGSLAHLPHHMVAAISFSLSRPFSLPPPPPFPPLL